MANIIVIHGPMGSGKSTIVSKLKDKLPNYVLVDRAYIKDVMLKNIKTKNSNLAKELSKEAVFLIAKGLLKHNINIILQELRAPTVKKRVDKKHRIISFYLHCTLTEAKKRDRIRQKKYIRPKLVEEMHNKHAYPDKEDIEINTEKNSIIKTINLIINKIKK
ncbi:AAA family ATPase [Candidatus Woesearchaeota archaeon]|nr:AAA family ATPase [Candidatus Woesearchaeota archaeon]MBT4368230.1 AAA family ATPase [Candidatus Woesearchaeota archaeon]MBT4712719.1 AAA family ATPase [Candidatus Woesearchaeota archaeon]MBT6639631.1 AAA family ATPase [Candidatus Woesearchaeota archaeon]MBT7133803.1 AAA family ATPase [Candidatus Woesearchaeota archaeon]